MTDLVFTRGDIGAIEYTNHPPVVVLHQPVFFTLLGGNKSLLLGKLDGVLTILKVSTPPPPNRQVDYFTFDGAAPTAEVVAPRTGTPAPGGFAGSAEARDRKVPGCGQSSPATPMANGIDMDTLRAALEASFDAVLLLGGDRQRILYANRAARDLLILPADAWEQISPSDLGLDEIIAEAGETVSISTDRELDLPVSLRRSDGTVVTADCRVVLPTTESSDSSVAILVLRPTSTSAYLPKTTRDPLTGLVDRRVFEARLAKMLERGRNEQSSTFALLFIDLNGFKAINDAWGHLAGDHILREIAGRMRHCLRPDDTVARFGGDEFTVLLVGVGSACDATKAAERLLGRIGWPIDVDGREVAVSASIGIALSRPDYPNGQSLLEAADRAMYQAKTLGPSRYVVFDDDTCPPFRKP